MSAVLEFLRPTIVRSVEAACAKIDTGNSPCLLQETQMYLKTPGHPRWRKSVGMTGKLAGMRKTTLVKECHNGVSYHFMHGCQCEQLRSSTTRFNFPFHGIHKTIAPYSSTYFTLTQCGQTYHSFPCTNVHAWVKIEATIALSLHLQLL